MIYQILFVLFLWLYFAGEGKTEGLTWKTNFEERFRINSHKYHCWRWWVENMGLIGAFIVSHYSKIKNWELISLLAVISGLVIYLRFFSYGRFGKFWVYSTSRWFGIIKPPIWLQIVIFIFCIVSLMFIIL